MPARETPEASQPVHSEAPTAQSRRDLSKAKCRHTTKRQDRELDPWCDPDHPKTITYDEVLKASTVVKGFLPETPIVRSRWCKKLNMELYFKNEIVHRTGSFSERAAVYSLTMATQQETQPGFITASTGNWARALAYHGQLLHVPVTVVMPTQTPLAVAEFCCECGAGVVLYGEDMGEAKKHAFALARERGVPYLNGYDHPHVIAAAGGIAKEILKQLPETDVILVPVGGGGLLAGICVAAKKLKPDVAIYGVEPNKCCCFYKAMENELPYKTAIEPCLAQSLGAAAAGVNAFHTARSLIDKMFLIGEASIARAVLHLLEEERLVVEGAGACPLAALMTDAQMRSTLRGKTVVCLLTGGSVDVRVYPRCLQWAMAIQGRLVKLTISTPMAKLSQLTEVLDVIAKMGCNILVAYHKDGWIAENDLDTRNMTVVLETQSMEHACRLKRVLDHRYPDMCYFREEPFTTLPACLCNPN